LPPPFNFHFTCDLLLHGQITNDSATFKATVCEGNKDLHPDFSDCSSFYSPPSKTYLLPSKDNRIIHSIKKLYLIHYFFTDSIKGEKTDAKDFKKQNIFFLVIFIFLFSLEMSYGF
jgi:hypothetical protein